MRTDGEIWNYPLTGVFPIPINSKSSKKRLFLTGEPFLLYVVLGDLFIFAFLHYIVLTVKNFRDTIGTQFQRVYRTDGLVEMTTWTIYLA